MVLLYSRAAVPDAPQSVAVVEYLPTEVILSAVPPEEDGGMPVTGYRIEYEDRVADVSIGKLDDYRQTCVILQNN